MEESELSKCADKMILFFKEQKISTSKPFFIKRFFLWIFSWFSSTRTTIYDIEGLIKSTIKKGKRLTLKQIAYTLDNISYYLNEDKT